MFRHTGKTAVHQFNKVTSQRRPLRLCWCDDYGMQNW